ncbi:ComEC/Rec2 family competence protein [Acholeplasma palmae]|nr:MBL fold metallo-hydrolase [Alteracholeplasma palmae]
MKRLKTIFTLDDLHLYLLFVTIFILMIHYYLFVFIMLWTLIKVRKNKNIIIAFIILSFIIITIYIFIVKINFLKYGMIIEINKNEYYNQYAVKLLFKKIDVMSKTEFDIGDVIKVSGKIIQYEKELNPRGFNQKYFHLGNQVIGYIKTNEIIKIGSFKLFRVREYTQDFSKNEYISYMLLFYIYYKVVDKICYYFDLEERYQNIVYLVLTIVLMILFKMHYYLEFKLILLGIKIKCGNILSYHEKNNLAFIILILYQPTYILNQGFIVYLIIKTLLGLTQNKKIIILTLIPFILYWNQSFSLYDLLNLSYRNLKAILYPIQFFWKDYSNSHMLHYLSMTKLQLESIRFIYFKPNEVYFIGYFSSLIFIFKHKKIRIRQIYTLILLLMIVMIKYIIIDLNNNWVVFLDVGQGDTAVMKKNHQIIVVDAFDQSIDFLKTNGISKVDYLILTHSDLDHIKNAQKMIDQFKVETLIVSFYDNGYDIHHNNVIKIKDYMYHEKTEITFFGPFEKLESKNNNSVCFKIKINNKTILFTGDIEKEAEKNYIKRYGNNLKANLLKVAHHGSNTSSTMEFINYVNPSHAIISVGKNNTYGLPDIDVINSLKKKGIKVFITSENHAVTYNYKIFKNDIN